MRQFYGAGLSVIGVLFAVWGVAVLARSSGSLKSVGGLLLAMGLVYIGGGVLLIRWGRR